MTRRKKDKPSPAPADAAVAEEAGEGIPELVPFEDLQITLQLIQDDPEEAVRRNHLMRTQYHAMETRFTEQDAAIRAERKEFTRVLTQVNAKLAEITRQISNTD